MKRCPQCNRVENDDTLAFCRADGTALISDSGTFIGDASTAKSGSPPVSSEIETSLLPHTTDASINRATAPTTVLPATQTSDTTHYLSKPKRPGVLIALVAVTTAVIAVGYFYVARNSTTAIESIAVLPFQNTSGDPNAEYLSDGIAESLINSLTQLQQLRVIARTTAFHYKGKYADPRQIGRELNVQSVLTGRVRQSADTLNVQVDLIDTTTGAQIWGQEYERKAADTLSIKQAIVKDVRQRLQLKLSNQEQQRLTRSDATNAEAYQTYLRGRYFWNERRPDRIEKALAEFQHAIDLDPNFALGYVGIADCYVIQEENNGVPASESLPKARAAADRALQLDDSSAEAHTSSGMIYQHLWRWTEAENEYRRAIGLNSNYSTAHQWYSNFLFASGRLDESMREGKRAQELDPLSPIISHNVAFVYLLKNDPDMAMAVSTKALELNPNFTALLNDVGWAYYQQHRYEEAIVQFQKAVEVSSRGSTSLGNLGYCYARSGKRQEALGMLKELEQRYAEGKAVAVFLAGVYAGLGDKDKAFAILEKDYQQHSGQVPTITFWMSMEPLRSDPRYTELVRRIWGEAFASVGRRLL